MLAENARYAEEILPFWNALDKRQKSLAMEKLIERYWEKGKIIHSNEDCTGLLMVIKGQLRSFILSEYGREITLYRLFEGDVCILSSSCMMRNITFDIHLEAEKDSKILIMPAHVFKQLSESNLAVKDFQAEMVSARLSDVMWVMEQVVFMSMDRRLADFLLEQASIEGNDELLITHEAIARNLGTAREVVTRMLRYFQDEGMVTLSRGRVTVKNRKKLMNYTR